MASEDSYHHVTLYRVDQTAFLGAVWSGTAVSFVLLILRLTARLKAAKRLYVDDYLIVIAWLLILATAVIWQIVVSHLYEFYGVSGGAINPVPSTFVRDSEVFFKGFWAQWICFYTSLWLVKFSFLLFFRRLSLKVQSRAQRMQWWTITFLTIATYTLSLGLMNHKCMLRPLSYILTTCTSPKEYRFNSRGLRASCAVDFATDYLIMTIPISMLWKVRISFKKKLALAAIFSLTVITTVFAIVRVVLLGDSLASQPDLSLEGTWNFVEVSVALVVACVGSFPALFKRSEQKPKGQAAGPRGRYHFSQNAVRRGGRAKRAGTVILTDVSSHSGGAFAAHATEPSDLAELGRAYHPPASTEQV